MFHEFFAQNTLLIYHGLDAYRAPTPAPWRMFVAYAQNINCWLLGLRCALLIMATSGNDPDWDTLNLGDTEEQQYVVHEEPEEEEFRKIIVYDMKSKNKINHQIDSLQVTFESCENVFKAVYDVLRFLPNLDNPNSDYWKKEVIPNLSACLKQHIEARIFFYEAFGTINDLRNTMSTAARVIKQSKVTPLLLKLHKHMCARC
ncbi:unnamed protein product [Oppiella nova]|uniref:Uncharacterized protein n=1 Tax=Oppiella nova TaxID=334625 RepID=A0A7R9M5I9_9ACAR|nr:unnamed protein product [Oppiella nova]CAG2171041.1 unnamed protein product [Oppiella nova]